VAYAPATPRIFVLEQQGAEWIRITGSLRARGQSLPVDASPAFPAEGSSRRVLVGLEDGAGQPVWGAVAHVTSSRVVPWRSVVRAIRLGRDLDPALATDVGKALIELAHRSLALRLHVEVFEPEAFARERLVADLRRHGFQIAASSRRYERSVLIDLRPADPEEALLSTFHHTCRRHIRAFAKRGLICRAVADPEFAGRLRELTDETLARTGGTPDPTDWQSVIRFIREEPSRAVLLGVFRPDRSGVDALVGYVLGYRHDDTVEYSHAASARMSDLNAPLLYAPTWALMRWGRANGATWFDFGGVSTTRPHVVDPTAGINTFKRYFHAQATTVGCELVYAPTSGLDLAARAASASYRALRELA
jgi:hypothetical protein